MNGVAVQYLWNSPYNLNKLQIAYFNANPPNRQNVKLNQLTVEPSV